MNLIEMENLFQTDLNEFNRLRVGLRSALLPIREVVSKTGFEIVLVFHCFVL